MQTQMLLQEKFLKVTFLKQMSKYIKHLQLGEIQQAVRIISGAMRNVLQQ